jgi:hypothetical protein
VAGGATGYEGDSLTGDVIASGPPRPEITRTAGARFHPTGSFDATDSTGAPTTTGHPQYPNTCANWLDYAPSCM